MVRGEEEEGDFIVRTKGICCGEEERRMRDCEGLVVKVILEIGSTEEVVECWIGRGYIRSSVRY